MAQVAKIGFDGQLAYVEEDLPDLTPEPTLQDYQSAIQSLVDETARSMSFNDGVTMASYAASTVGPWAAQAQAFIAWRDNVWQYAYFELSKVNAGERTQPSVADFLLELPEIVWP